MKKRNCFTLTLLLALSLAFYLPEATAAPTQINACQKITRSGSYQLARNLTAAGNCIVLAADFVTIDLNGFTITGNGTGIAVLTDQQANRRGYVVRRGMITNFKRGVDLSNALDAVIEEVYAAENTGVGIYAGYSSIVTGNVVRGSGEVGIETLDGSIVRGNAVIGTKKGALGLGNGIVVNGGTLVSDNTSNFNAGHGIYVTCPSNITGNTAINNSDGNISLNPATPTGCSQNNNVAP
jgi:hypothetical protein